MNHESRKKSPIILLHGWGLRGQTYKVLATLLKKNGHKAYVLDLPGFGTEPLVNDNMILDDYVVFLRKFIEKNNITPPILIGHSFGGRVAIKYAWKYKNDVALLILTGVPVIRHTSITKKIAYFSAVIGGFIFKIFPKETQMFMRKVLYALIGEWDYYKAGSLQQVFKNIIGEELTMYAKEIRIPTLLVWGADDLIVPATDVEKIKEYIPHAKSIVIKNEDHKMPYTNPKSFFNAIKSVL